MGKKTLILSQKQLDEIMGANGAYLDNAAGDFIENGNNEVYSGDKLTGADADPITTDKISHQLANNNGYNGYGGNGRDFSRSPLFFYESTTKDKWAKKNLREDNQDLVNKTYGDDQNRVSNTNASTLKWRYGAAKAKAQSSDPTERKQGLSTMKTMEKNNPNLALIQNQYNTAMANDRNLKRSAKDMGEENVFQAAGGTKQSGNGEAHTQKTDSGIITYEQ